MINQEVLNKQFKTEIRRLRRFRAANRLQWLFKQEREARALRDARSHAEAVEGYLANLNSTYRQVAIYEMD